MRTILTCVLCLMLALSAGCGMFGKEKKDETEGWTAERLYSEARGALDSGYYQRAVDLYQKLEARFPFGVYGQQALMDLAYAYYKNDEHDASVNAADRFIKLYPRNRHVDYAYYLRGLANFNRGKGLTQRFLPTDSSQRDMSNNQQAFNDFAELLKRFPDTVYAEDARLRMTYLRNLLAQHEVHVAHYYMRRGAYIAAANRGRYVVENYQRTPAMPEALTIMAKSYKILEMDDLAEDALRVLNYNFPNYPGYYEAQQIVVR